MRHIDKRLPKAVGLRRCNNCEQALNPASFNKDRRRPSGLDSWCRECRNSNSRHRIIYPEAYARWLYRSLRTRCGFGVGGKNYWLRCPNQRDNELHFTLAEFERWLADNVDWRVLWDDFVEYGCDKALSPTVTRVNSKSQFTIDNIAMVTKGSISQANMVLLREKRGLEPLEPTRCISISRRESSASDTTVASVAKPIVAEELVVTALHSDYCDICGKYRGSFRCACVT